MTDPDNPLLNQNGGKDKKGKPSFGWAILRLYRNDPVWRGAVDMILIGTTIFLLMLGFPDILKGLDRFIPGSTASVSAVPDSSQATAPAGANFSVPTNTAAIHQPAHSQPQALPLPAQQTPRYTWINNPTPAEIEKLEEAANLIPFSEARARALVEDKARAGDPNYQFLLAEVLVHAAMAPPDAAKMGQAIYWYKEAAAQDHARAQYQLAQIHRLGGPGISIDAAEALKWYELACKNPYNDTGEAENEVGRLYSLGKLMPVDKEKARDYFEAAAKKGNANGANSLASMHLNRELKGNSDLQEGIRWLRVAAEKGDSLAQNNMATMALSGRLTGKPDYPEFLKWAGLASDQGEVKAIVRLADFYAEGAPGFEPDQRLAAKFYRKAALKKDPKAQFSLARLYEQGLGLPQDKMQAYVYYSLAYKEGYTPAYGALETLKAGMSPAELDYGAKMAEALTPTSKPLVGTTFSGIGISYTLKNGSLLVTGSVPDGPAEKAGLQIGDRITAIDGKPVAGSQDGEAARMIRGAPGSSVALTYTRAGETEEKTVSVKRALIQPSGASPAPAPIPSFP